MSPARADKPKVDVREPLLRDKGAEEQEVAEQQEPELLSNWASGAVTDLVVLHCSMCRKVALPHSGRKGWVICHRCHEQPSVESQR